MNENGSDMGKYIQIQMQIFIFTRIWIPQRTMLKVLDIDIHCICISYIPLEYLDTDTEQILKTGYQYDMFHLVLELLQLDRWTENII